jgi:hypothetical protein
MSSRIGHGTNSATKTIRPKLQVGPQPVSGLIHHHDGVGREQPALVADPVEAPDLAR